MARPAGDPGIVYEETQHLREPWIWAIVGLVTLAMFGTAAWAAMTGDESTTGLILLVGTGLAIPAFVAFVRLRVVVTHREVFVSFRPFLRRRFPLTDIVSAEALTYSPLREFGGWGIRRGRGGRRAYTIDGNRGVELRLASGRRIVVGSRRPEALAAAIGRPPSSAVRA